MAKWHRNENVILCLLDSLAVPLLLSTFLTSKNRGLICLRLICPLKVQNIREERKRIEKSRDVLRDRVEEQQEQLTEAIRAKEQSLDQIKIYQRKVAKLVEDLRERLMLAKYQ